MVPALVTRFTVDDALTLHCRRADGLTGTIRCDGVAELHHPDGVARVSPDQDPASCGPALALLANAADALDYLWTYAEQLGIADRLLVVVSSDFSRTPYYNSGNGKDHWNIGSYVIMEKNRSFTNRAVGETDGVQNARKIMKHHLHWMFQIFSRPPPDNES